VNLAAYRLTKQNELFIVDYHDLMLDKIDEVTVTFLPLIRTVSHNQDHYGVSLSK
jgi:hypothetical protein